MTDREGSGRIDPALPPRTPAVEDAEGVVTISGLTLAQAECLLDRLQNRGLSASEVTLDENGVTVRFKNTPGDRRANDGTGSEARDDSG